MPKDEQVLEAIIEGLAGGKVNSLSKLTQDVLAILNDGGLRYALTTRRIKKVASLNKVIRIRMITRRATRTMSKCPLCGGKLGTLDARDLFGEDTKGGKVCKSCQFEMDPGKREPARYIFDLRW